MADRLESRNETLEVARQALVVAADKLLQAAEMEERNYAIAHGKRGKAWDGDFVLREKRTAMEAVRAALADNIGRGSIQSETAAIPEEFSQLARFYDVTDMAALVRIQAEHIERLQKKLPPLRGPESDPQNYRRG